MKLVSLLRKRFTLNYLLISVFIAVTWVNFNQERWKRKDVIASDVAHYYSYLPAAFYEKDLSLSFLSDSINQWQEVYFYSPNYTSEHKAVIKMSMGMSLSYLPFFALAHFYAHLFDYPVNGFSEPYQFAIQFASLFYYLIGIFFLWKVLRFYFSQEVAFITLFCISFGTNAFYYLTLGAGMAHVTDFGCMSAFLLLTLQWHKEPRLSKAILLGCLGGFLVLLRPINVLVVLFFFFYRISSIGNFRSKINFFLSYKLQIVAVIFFSILVFIPQMLYWKFVTGHFLFNSYVGEHFFFDNPHIFKALFGFRKGWFIYTPIMLAAVVGFFFLREKLKEFSLALPVFFIVYLYVAFSWWCWWYGGSFSQRVLIDIYPFLAIPFAAVIKSVQNFKKTKMILYTLLICFILLNLFQTIQAKYNIIHYDAMTRQNYFKVFFTITKQEGREKYLDHPDYDKAKRGEEED
ncbi:hypothetical protein CNR22_09940 [Sphingobacteriaceae bacterium]|nr:hypothetical protein CNR22_09940 [Sphingobacteriaceae bacterium]